MLKAFFTSLLLLGIMNERIMQIYISTKVVRSTIRLLMILDGFGSLCGVWCYSCWLTALMILLPSYPVMWAKPHSVMVHKALKD